MTEAGKDRLLTSDDGSEVLGYRQMLTDPHTIGDLFDWVCRAADDGRAQQLLTAYRQVHEHADENIGYVIGYAEPPERRKALYEAYNLVHPVLGGRP